MVNVIQELLEELHAKYAGLDDGQVATYIPQLAKACPRDFGIAIATADGRVYEVGDTRKCFTIQSISKPFIFGLGLKLLTPERLSFKVDVEPSGEAFNAISLNPESGKPRNPMINAGAIAISAQISAHDPAGAEALLLNYFSELAGRPLEVDEAVYRSESETGHRNRAIGHLLRNFNIIESDPEAALDLYFRQCAISVDCRDLAVMAATLACQGRNPFTNEFLLNPDITVRVLALMGSCGMYDFAGQWLHDVGIPAKSGVAGGVLAVLPGRLGIAIYSPPLDGFGNSVRGVAVCSELSHGFGLSMFNQYPQTGTTIRRSSRGSERQSRRFRTDRESLLLKSLRDQIRIIQVQGVLDFPALEQLAAALVALLEDTRVLILDLAYVTELPVELFGLLDRQLAAVLACGIPILISRTSRLPIASQSLLQLDDRVPFFEHLDTALETAENLMIEAGAKELAASEAPDDDLGFLRRLSPRSRAVLKALMNLRSFQPGDPVFRRGEQGQELFFVRSGCFNTRIELIGTGGESYSTRLATFCSGMCFGEIAFISGSLRSADVSAVEGGSCWVLQRSDFDALQQQEPAVVIDVLRALSCDLGQKLAQASVQLTLMEQH